MTDRVLHYRVRNGPEQQIHAGELVTIGRSPSCTVVLNTTTVEAEQCRIVRRGDRYSVEDRGSQLGTYVVRPRMRSPQLCYPDQEFGDDDRLEISCAKKPIFVAWWGAAPAAKTVDPPPEPGPPSAPASTNHSALKDEQVTSASTAVDDAAAHQQEILDIRRQCEQDVRDIRRQYDEICEEYEERQAAFKKQVHALEADVKRLKDDALNAAVMHSAALNDEKRRHKVEQLRLVEVGSKAAALAAERAVIIEDQEGRLQCLEHRIRELEAELRNCRAAM